MSVFDSLDGGRSRGFLLIGMHSVGGDIEELGFGCWLAGQWQGLELDFDLANSFVARGIRGVVLLLLFALPFVFLVG